MIILSILFLSLASCKMILPLTEIDKQYLFNLTVGGTPLLFRIDFEGKQSSIRLSANHKNNSLGKLKVSSRRHELGEMVFQEYKKSEADIDVGGVIGLGPESSFIRMLEDQEGKTVSLTFQLNKSIVTISNNILCENVHFAPYLLQVGTWSSFPIETPLSFNFNPPEDFLALLNTTKQPFTLNQSRYALLSLDVEFLGQRKQLLVKQFINCWKFEGSHNQQCEVKIGKDVGLLMFQYPIVITRKGLCLQGGEKGKIDYDARFVCVILLNIVTIIVFLYWEEIRHRMREEKVYIPTSVSEYSIQKMSLVQDMVSG